MGAMTTTQTLTGREYLRVSQDRYGTGKSPDQQHDDNARTFPGALGQPYREPGSASASRYARKARETFQRLLGDLRSDTFGADALVLWESSRGSRTVGEWVTLLDLCEAHDVKIFVTTHGRLYDPKNARDRRTLLEDAVDSEYESAKNSARIRRNTAATADAGLPHGRILYGYRREYTKDPRGKLIFSAQLIRDDQAEIVREAARRVVAGDSCYGIAQDFNRRGVPIPHKPSNPRNFPEWNGAQIKRMVTNPGYIGKRVHQGKIVGDAVWPAILDDETFYTALEILNDPKRKQTKDGAVKYLLTGIMTCGECGRISKTGRQNSSSGHYKTYMCKGFCTTRRCSYVDQYITNLTIERLTQPDLLEVLSDDADESPELRGMVAEKKSRLREIEKEISGGGRAVSILVRSADALSEEIEQLEERIKRASVSPVIAEFAGPDAQEKWDRASIVRQREVVRSLFVDIRMLPVPKEDRGKRGFNDSLIDPVWIPGLQNEKGKRITVPPADPNMPDVARNQRVRRTVEDAPEVSREQKDAIRHALNS